MEPFSYPKPQMPAHVRDRATEYDLLNRALTSALAGRSAAAMRQAEELRARVAERLAQPLTVRQREAEDRYNLEVRKYNEAVTEYNARLAAAKQARVNARETTKIRKSTCNTCFTVHAGDCY